MSARKPLEDLTGMVFSRLTVQGLFGKKGGRYYWTCKCICGNTREVLAQNLKNGSHKSCGCLHRERTAKMGFRHGYHGEVEYETWRHMMERCSNPKAHNYSLYGERGISVCERWHHYPNFVADMGCRPGPDRSIDRIDSNGNYEPSNCRWGTVEEQNNNRRSNVIFTLSRESLSLAQWCRKFGIHAVTVTGRLKRGWSIVAALTIPSDQRRATSLSRS